ncbi:hypothetical protein HY468_05015 [Candidatus Roizmanbacteria bacterium]|nr:hypothetical protein [Candidatus Roizmanbacteria bacterium]
MEHVTHNIKQSSRFHVPGKNGYSLVELLTVVGMMMILLSIGGLAFSNLRSESQLDMIASRVKSELLRVQARSENEIESGVYFASNRFVSYEGASYIEGDPGNVETLLPGALSITTINFDSFIARFDHVSGYLENYTDPSGVVLTETGSGKTRTIAVNRWGVVEIQ